MKKRTVDEMKKREKETAQAGIYRRRSLVLSLHGKIDNTILRVKGSGYFAFIQ